MSPVHALDVLGDPVRRRILEVLAEGERSSGEIVEVISAEFEISQPAVSYQLKILRQNGFATARAEAQKRIYEIKSGPFTDVENWLASIGRYWDHKLDALGTEIARGKKRR